MHSARVRRGHEAFKSIEGLFSILTLVMTCSAIAQYDEAHDGAEVGGIRDAARGRSHSRKLRAALVAELIGMMIFQIYGGNAPDSVAAFGNGITLVVLGA